MKPEAVIFDMDDVLCRYDLGKRLRVLSRISGKTPRDIRAAIWDSGFEDAADSGGFSDPDQYLAEFNQRIGFELSRADWIKARREAMTPWPEMLALARTIVKQARTAIYTNNGPLTKASIGELFPELAQVFGQVFMITRGGPELSTRTLVQYIYDTAFNNYRMGYAAAISWLLFLVIAVFSIIQFRLMREKK